MPKQSKRVYGLDSLTLLTEVKVPHKVVGQTNLYPLWERTYRPKDETALIII